MTTARGEDRISSDLDLLVTTPPEFDLFDKALLVKALDKELGAPVDIVPDDAHSPVVARARGEARAL